MSKRMNVGLQSRMIREMMAGSRSELELFDVDAYIDPKLTLTENRRNIAKIHGISFGGPKDYGRQSRLLKSDTQGEFYQIGKSKKSMDERRAVKPPGERYSKKTGKRYIERRKNRSDKPGRLV